jgi:hypothetical protein
MLGPAFSVEWSWRESNPRPPTDPSRRLRAYPPVLFSSLAHRPVGSPSRTSRENLACAVTAPNAGQPEFIDARRPASGGADRKTGGKETLRSLLTQPGRSYRSRLLVSRRFYEVSEDLGTQPRLHHTRRNLDSPKPVFSNDAPNLPAPCHPVNPIVPQGLTISDLPRSPLCTIIATPVPASAGSVAPRAPGSRNCLSVNILGPKFSFRSRARGHRGSMAGLSFPGEER